MDLELSSLTVLLVVNACVVLGVAGYMAFSYKWDRGDPT